MAEMIIVGDIHGEIRSLEALIREVGSSSGEFVFLGDYINRGPHSREVVDFLIDFGRKHSSVFLSGNHEWAFLRYLEIGEFDRFALLGGLSTLASYLPRVQSGNIRKALIERLPDRHLQFYKQLKIFFENDRAICSHAGVPNACPDDRSFQELVLGAHPELFSEPTVTRKLNVCGHYLQESRTPFRFGKFVCLDTGCGTLPNGKLTALLLPEMRFVQV